MDEVKPNDCKNCGLFMPQNQAELYNMKQWAHIVFGCPGPKLYFLEPEVFHANS